jgi:DNA replication licensing factor MCM2
MCLCLGLSNWTSYQASYFGAHFLNIFFIKNIIGTISTDTMSAPPPRSDSEDEENENPRPEKRQRRRRAQDASPPSSPLQQAETYDTYADADAAPESDSSPADHDYDAAALQDAPEEEEEGEDLMENAMGDESGREGIGDTEYEEEEGEDLGNTMQNYGVQGSGLSGSDFHQRFDILDEERTIRERERREGGWSAGFYEKIKYDDISVSDRDYDDKALQEEEGEDLDNAMRDYQRIAILDEYGREGIDDTEYTPVDAVARREAERTIRERERRQEGRGEGFYDTTMEQEDEEDEEALQERRRRIGAAATATDDADLPEDAEEDEDLFLDGDDVYNLEALDVPRREWRFYDNIMEQEDEESDLDGEDVFNSEAFDVPLREWIAQDRTRREIQRKFRMFLNRTYEDAIRRMCAANEQSLVISYLHLMEAEPTLAYWLADSPRDMFLVLNEAATQHTLALWPAYRSISTEIQVRIDQVPIVDSLRDLRRSHLDCLVQVHGVVTRRSQVTPQLRVAYYTCLLCQYRQGPFYVEAASVRNSHESAVPTPEVCTNPTSCPGSAFRLHPTQSQYANVQRVHLQETPGSVPPGRVPRTKEIYWSDDLIDVARPGEEIQVTGIYEHALDYTLTLQSGFPVFGTYITANHVRKRDFDRANLSAADVAEIRRLAQDPRIGQRIVNSIAPSIYGHDFCKMALAMSLFGAVPKNVDEKHRVRGDVNVLLLGESGTAKSQLLKYAQHMAPRAVYCTGKGANAAGLTASVHKDPVTREWTLEGGALVLADQGVCLIDEFDKMNEQDRSSIHEAMEQQTISVSKAGIVTSLQARCAIIAAANPIGGRYDSAHTLAENVELTDPVLQRFDILCVLQDLVDPVADEHLAQFVTSSHMKAVPTRQLPAGTMAAPVAATNETDPDLIPQDLLSKYIQYARTHVRPVLTGNPLDQEMVASLNALRRESAVSGGVPIAVRHVESLMRMAEAHAKMHLREYVRDVDMNAAMRMLLEP